jgi:hypothetical protein
MSRGSTANIQIREPGPKANKLVESVRLRVADHLVGVDDHGGGLFRVTDFAGRVEGDMQSFVAAALDACGLDAGVYWQRYLTLAQGE